MNQRDRAKWVKQDYDLFREQKTSGLSMSRWLKENRERVDAKMKASLNRGAKPVASANSNN
jgi:hypothetical protein